MNNQLKLKHELEEIHKKALTKLYRLAREASKRGLTKLVNEIHEEAWKLDGNISYLRFFESYKYAYIFFE